jgi:hypothetical protein
MTGVKPMKLRDRKKALTAVAVAAFAAHPGRARAEDIAAEIHQLKEEVKALLANSDCKHKTTLGLARSYPAVSASRCRVRI